jgi:hypothetical protein
MAELNDGGIKTKIETLQKIALKWNKKRKAGESVG